MPYDNLDELPKQVTNNLPKHAQEIYLKAFNNAWKEYQDSSKQRDPAQKTEETAHKVAWNAVKQKYHKNEQGDWLPKD